MRKIVLALLDVVLIASPATEIQYAKNHRRARRAGRFTGERFRNSNAVCQTDRYT